MANSGGYQAEQEKRISVIDLAGFTVTGSLELPVKNLNRLYDVFVEECEKRGYEAMLYGSKYYLDTIWVKTDERKIWLAQYTDEPSFDGNFEVWQLSESGQIDGIEGHVDLDILYLQEE